MSCDRTRIEKLYTTISVSKTKGDDKVARIVDYSAQNLVGNKVKKYRIERNMSQQELSERLETYAIYVCRGSISRIEGRRRTVTDYELKALASALDVTIDDLFE